MNFKPKISIVFLLIISFSFASLANAADLDFTDDTNVTINGQNFVILAGSGATSLEVTSTTLTVTADPVAIFTLKSPDRFLLDNDRNIKENCSSDGNSVTVSNSRTVVITPNINVTCGGGGSSGGSVPRFVSPVAVNPVPPQTTPATYSFGTGVVRWGSTGESCKAWQMFLRDKVNSQLKVDGLCGKATYDAARIWQSSVGLKADGILGPMSRAKAGNLSAPIVPAVNTKKIITNPGTKNTTTNAIKIVPGDPNPGRSPVVWGSKGEDCKSWQIYLQSRVKPDLKVDGICGKSTYEAAITWQKSVGLKADGILGAESRAKAIEN